MEETIITEDQLPDENSEGMALSPLALHYLRESAKWARFLGIMGFIGTGIILLFALFATSLFSFVQSINPTPPTPFPLGIMGPFIMVIYLIVAVLCFFPSLFLYRFGAKAKNAIQFKNEHEITEAFSNLKSFLKFWGIYIIIYLGFIALFLLGAIIIGGIAAIKH